MFIIVNNISSHYSITAPMGMFNGAENAFLWMRLYVCGLSWALCSKGYVVLPRTMHIMDMYSECVDHSGIVERNCSRSVFNSVAGFNVLHR